MFFPFMLLNDPQIRQILKEQEVLRGKKKLAKGFFSGVYEGTREDTVLKLSICQPTYDFMMNKSDNPHFPKVIKDYGVVGEYEVAKKQSKMEYRMFSIHSVTVPVYLYEVEKLEKASIENRRIGKKLHDLLYKDWDAFRESDRPAEEVFQFGFENMLASGYLDDKPTIRDAFQEMATFFLKGTADTDVSMQNFMQRKDGTLIINDPFSDRNMVSAVIQPPKEDYESNKDCD